MPALAHRLRCDPSSGCSGCARRTSCGERARAASRRRAAEDRARAREPARVTRAATAKLGAYATLAGAGLARGARARPPGAGRACAAPFAALLAVGLARARRRASAAALDLTASGRSTRAEPVEADLELRRRRPSRASRSSSTPGRGSVVGDAEPAAARPSRRAAARDRATSIRCERWGAYLVGELVLRAHDAFGLFVFEQDARRAGRPLKVYPRGEMLPSSCCAPLETQAFAGNQVARTRGEGIEFADLRPFVPGDRVRRVNWRATARRGEPWVNETHPERNTDVVIFLDTVRRGPAAAAEHARPSRAAPRRSLAAHYLREKLTASASSPFGGVLNWLTVPRAGSSQLYRDRRLAARRRDLPQLRVEGRSTCFRRGTLPPHALVLALTPLLDERAVGALLDLRARGFDLAVVEISPVPFAARGRAGARRARAPALACLRRDALRSALPARSECRSPSGATASRSRPSWRR